jgi:hypothetical protein
VGFGSALAFLAQVLERSVSAPEFAAQFSKNSKERSQTRPSQNVSVRKNFAACFQWLTEILIEPLFRLDVPQQRITGEQFGPDVLGSSRLHRRGRAKRCAINEQSTPPGWPWVSVCD